METSVSLLGRIAGAPTEDDWRRLDQLYRPLLRAWMARAGVAAADVDDLVQDVLVVVSREIAGFEWRGQGAFRAWLRKIVANRMRDYFRRQKYRPTATGGSDFLRRLDELESPDSALSRLWDREHDQHVTTSLLRRVQGDCKLPWGVLLIILIIIAGSMVLFIGAVILVAAVVARFSKARGQG
jgi:RNA polymerase sigma-70 factor (ECF subfamily)